MILVAGDYMIDRYWFGVCDRLSPEAPAPVMTQVREEEREGGARNVANNVRAMGGRVKELYSLTHRKTPVVKLRLIARTQQIARVDYDHPQAPIDRVAFRERSSGCDLVIFSDYGKGSLSNLPELVDAAKKRRMQILVDPKVPHWELYQGIDVLKPNILELQSLVGRWSSEEDLRARVTKLRGYARIGAVLLTRGDLGMSLFCSMGILHYAAQARGLADVSGAGDSAIAALAVALWRGESLDKAAYLANKAAGIATSRFGTTVVREEEVGGV